MRVSNVSSASVPQQAQRRQQRRALRVRAEATIRHGAVVAKPDMRFAVVVGRFNDLVTKLLLEGALGAFKSHGANLDNVQVGRAAKTAARTCGHAHALCCVIQRSIVCDQLERIAVVPWNSVSRFSLRTA
jgi:hypothetical protein